MREPLDFDFLKDRYDFELQRKEQLTSALALPVGGLGSLLAVMVRTFSFHRDLTGVAFGLALLAALVSFFCCLVCLARTYHRQTYKYLPTLRELDDKLGEWRSFYREVGSPGAETDFFVHELRAHIIEAADRNTENNDARSYLLYWARLWLFSLLAFATLCGFAYVVSQVKFYA
ncbi:MAG: hypothetical protein ABMA15_30775 [Vicinamibacterales bacterium]